MPEPPRDLVERTFGFAKRVRAFVNLVPRTPANIEDIRQLIRASGSVAANYLESQEGLSRRDFFYRVKVCRKEVRESALWLALLETASRPNVQSEREWLKGEANELKRIFSAIAAKDDTGD
jgi:four helix bundle protein